MVSPADFCMRPAFLQKSAGVNWAARNTVLWGNKSVLNWLLAVLVWCVLGAMEARRDTVAVVGRAGVPACVGLAANPRESF